MSRKNGLFFIAGIFAALVAAGFARQKNRRSVVPNLRLWGRALQRQHGRQQAQQITELVQQRYEQLMRAQPRYENRRLQLQLAGVILPGLALYQGLKEHHENQQELLVEMEKYLGMPFSLPMKVIPLFRFLPSPFAFFRRAFGSRMRDFPAEGWDIDWLEDGGKAVAFNISRCFYLDVLTRLGAPELTPAFCSTDELLASAFPPSIRFVRCGTLARGDPCCDFRYERT